MIFGRMIEMLVTGRDRSAWACASGRRPYSWRLEGSGERALFANVSETPS